MTTIILTIIGILLAAAAALMVIFYGGDAFNSGTVGAQANQIQNAATNISSAVQMFKAEQARTPTSMAELTTTTNRPNGAYLEEVPALPASLSGLMGFDNNRLIYWIENVPAQTCARINSNLRVSPAVAATGAAARNAATTSGAAKMACYPTAVGAAGTFVIRA